jgi:gas vesicle protein
MRRSFTYLGWVLAGGVVGVAVGLLAAPASGRETRRRLSRRIADLHQETGALLRRGQRNLQAVVNG